MTGTLRRPRPGGPRHARFLRGGVEDPDRRTASIKARQSLVGRSSNSGLERSDITELGAACIRAKHGSQDRHCKSGLERSDILSNNIGGEAPIAEPPASRQDTALLDEAA
jgi:hypothetical protein